MSQFKLRSLEKSFARPLPGAALLVLAILSAPVVADDAAGWTQLPKILENIQPPSFPDHDFSIRDHGAVDDGQSDCRSAIVQAIDACSEAGGGRVVVSAGKWFVKGPIHLKSGVNLHVAEGATLLFSADPADYLPAVFTRFEGTEVMNYSPLIYAFEQENIAITGKGTLDGQASGENWWSLMRGGGEDIAKLTGMAEAGVPPAERAIGTGSRLRPNFVQPYRCKNVLIEGVTLNNSPMWNLNPVLCDNVTVRGVTVDSHGPNNDGCNPECSRNVLIENCLFDTGDDCIAIKSGRNADGRRVGIPSENIIVRNCTMKDGHGGVVLGSEMSGGIRNIFVEDCQMDSPQLERAIRLKSNSMRGGYLENLFVRNVEVGQVSDAVVRINLFYGPDRGNQYPSVSNVYIENVTANRSKYPFYLHGLESSPIRNVVIADCTFRNAAEPSIIENVDEITLKNFRLLPSQLDSQ